MLRNSPSFFCSLFYSSLLTLTLAGCACTDPRKPQANHQNEHKHDHQEVAQVTALQSPKSSALKAIAVVKPYQDHKISGTVTFTTVPGGIRIVADVDGLKPGKHGFHVHEHGDCSGHDGMKAGGHFNPTNTKHGGPDSAERHVGDFGNLEADAKGHAHYDRIDTLISLEGTNSIVGRSIMIHADPDDFITQPTGNSGPRIACGKIELVEESAAAR